MPPTIPTELAKARRSRELAWNEYMQIIDRQHDYREFHEALNKAGQADKIAADWYARWQAVGGTSDIESIVAAEIEQENQRITDWLQADNAARLYGDAIVDRMNDRAGYDLFGAMARKTPERVAWEQEYLKKREAETAKRRKERR